MFAPLNRLETLNGVIGVRLFDLGMQDIKWRTPKEDTYPPIIYLVYALDPPWSGHSTGLCGQVSQS